MTNKKLKVSWISNAPFSPSGYGQQTYDIERQFVKSGWDGTNFSLINMFGQSGSSFVDSLGITNYPNIDHAFGSDALLHHSKHFKSDVTFTLFDLWPQNPTDLAQAGRVIPWMPIDYDPTPLPLIANLRFADRIIAMSRFGQKAMADKGFSSTYIPHHVDTSIFYPTDKKEAKAKRGINPNLFVFGMVAANKDLMPRKSFQQVLDAFALFIKDHPNTVLSMHVNADQPGGFPIRQYAQFLGIEQNLLFPERYKWQFDTTKEEMNTIYNSFDCFLNPSSTEGFGIPIIEAQACSVPVIVNDYTSMPELVVDKQTGFVVKPGCRHFFPIGSYMVWPDTQDLYEKMGLVYLANREEMGKKAKAFIDQNFALDKVWQNKWLPFLDKIEQELYSNNQPAS